MSLISKIFDYIRGKKLTLNNENLSSTSIINKQIKQARKQYLKRKRGTK